MKKQKTRLKIVLVGYFVFFIPIFFLCYQLNRLYNSTKEEYKKSLKEELLKEAINTRNDLNPQNFLNSEFNKIHSKLFPDFPEEVTDKTPEDSFLKTLYTKEKLDKLVSLTKEKYTPIIITLGTNNLNDVYTYYSPELEKQIITEIEKINLGYEKFIFDIKELNNKYREYFNKKININPKKNNKSLLFKYLTRFREYKLYDERPVFTDYFDRQIIYNITRHSFSKKGIHGYYSLIIPQSSIDPEEMINNILSKSNDKLKIELVDSDENNIKETPKGFEYNIKFTTPFINQIYVFNRIRQLDRFLYLNKRIKLSINYPSDLEKLSKMNLYSETSAIILMILYFFITINFIKGKTLLNTNITQKLILILSVILFLPIIGTGLIIYTSSKNIDNLIDYNVSENLHNEIENIYIKNQENNIRQTASIFETKKRIAKIDLNNNFSDLTQGLITYNELNTWFYSWNTDFFIYNNKNEFSFLPPGYEKRKPYNISQSESLNFLVLKKFYNNLGLLDKQKKDKFYDTVVLGGLEKYFSSSIEEQRFGNESIPNTEIFRLKDTYWATFYYCKDVNNYDNLFLSKKFSNHNLTYNYLSKQEANNTNYFNPKHEFSTINLGIKLNDYEGYPEWPKINNKSSKTKELLSNTITIKDSISKKIKNKNGSEIKESIFTQIDPFIIAGTAQSHYNYKLYLAIKMVFPILFSYAILLLIYLTGFISVFIKKPISIYNEGIKSLENDEYGTTIKSFSKDEFNYITNAFNEMSVAIKQKEQISRYVSSKLLQSVKENDIQEIGDGKEEKVTILSSDIRNFTGISEQYEPSAIVEMLNSYFTKMEKAISSNGGIIDKYIGDAIQAVFYDEPDKENQVLRATKAAIDMRKALKEFNDERKKAGLFTIENGIGIDTDIATTGTIGTNEGRKDFSVNGEVIDRAAALEAKTKMTNSKILLSKISLKELDCHGSFQSLAMTDNNESKISLSANADIPLYKRGYKNNASIEDKTQITPFLKGGSLQSKQGNFKEFDEDSVEVIYDR